ncbi:Gfo/Idh/MocA family protein [Spongiactinospora sp. 9N601]|uniref:Gfo/Idh/MocA family protein n=1 Tax=Spongiactinospora sp. 9N601 TaxID=3375149 RepID=UPI0037953DF3
MNQQIGVGILGANPDRGWAARAHVPAINASPHFALAAVATTRAESAHAARERFGAAHAFTDPVALSRHPDVDLVVVTVKVPAHVELVTAALEAGKHVYCEWPLTRTSAEAAALAEAAERAGVLAVVGLQARFAPSVARAREMIADGAIGTVLSANVFSSRAKGGALDVPAWTAYTYDATTGAGLVEVLGGHALDLVQHVLGPIGDLSARTAVRVQEHRIAETGEAIAVTAPDQLLAIAEFDGGAVAAVHVLDGETARPHTRLEISGTAGKLMLLSAPETEPQMAQLQISPLDLWQWQPGATTPDPILPDADEASTLPIEAANVARLYRRLAADLHDHTRHAPSFRDAQRLHALIERMRANPNAPSPRDEHMAATA